VWQGAKDSCRHLFKGGLPSTLTHSTPFRRIIVLVLADHCKVSETRISKLPKSRRRAKSSRPHPFACFSFLILLVRWNCPFFLAQLFGDAILISVSRGRWTSESRSQLRLATSPSENAKIYLSKIV